jgi:hypothetical protein
MGCDDGREPKERTVDLCGRCAVAVRQGGRGAALTSFDVHVCQRMIIMVEAVIFDSMDLILLSCSAHLLSDFGGVIRAALVSRGGACPADRTTFGPGPLERLSMRDRALVIEGVTEDQVKVMPVLDRKDRAYRDLAPDATVHILRHPSEDQR